MMKALAIVMLVGTPAISNAYAQGPSLTASNTKKDAKEASLPVVAPLAVGTAFNCSLGEAIDTRKTKAGDTVVAEVAEDVTYERTMILPKGTKITGKVVRVTAGGRGRTGSAVFVQFDRATLKDGQEVVFSAGIQALAASAAPAVSGDSDSLKNLDSDARALPVEDSSAWTAGSDALVVSTVYDKPNPALRTPLGAAPVAQGEIGLNGMFSPDSRGAFGRADLKVYTPTSEGSHGTVLLSAKKNMRIDGGTRILLVIQPPPSADTADSNQPLNLDPSE
jgi:hypothetical protein